MALQLGSSGPEVTHVQQQLSDIGFPIGVDGTFGAMTDEAVRGFQLVVRLRPDGVVGPTTKTALDEGHWASIADEAITNLPQYRIQTTESVETTVGVTEFTADVKWYRVLVSLFYSTTSLNAKLDAMARSWISNMKATAQPVDVGGLPNSVIGALDATLIAQSLASSAGVLSEFVAGSAHPNPRVVVVNMDLAAQKTLTGPELFRAGSDWATALRGVVLLNGFDPANVVAAIPRNFSRVAITPSGLNLYLYPDQVGLPLAAGVQTIFCPWVRIESVVRPSIIARSRGGSAGGPGPHVV
jgi:Putative peptidoglycan binding domain